MTIYLTKNECGQTHHFRATLEEYGVTIVEGVFYQWLDKYYENLESNSAAIEKQQALVEEKIRQGFEQTPFLETPENDVDVYDKAKWHFSGDFPAGLPQFQAFVHTGMYVGWLIDSNLISEEFAQENQQQVEAFRQQKITGAQLFEVCCDGVLLVADLNETGNRFSLSYFLFATGEFVNDYEHTLAHGLPSQYHVADTRENYLKLKPVLDKRFLAWKEDNSSSVE